MNKQIKNILENMKAYCIENTGHAFFDETTNSDNETDLSFIENGFSLYCVIYWNSQTVKILENEKSETIPFKEFIKFQERFL